VTYNFPSRRKSLDQLAEELPNTMKNHTEDEKPQGEEGAQFGSSRQGFKKKTQQ